MGAAHLGRQLTDEPFALWGVVAGQTIAGMAGFDLKILHQLVLVTQQTRPRRQILGRNHRTLHRSRGDGGI